MSYVVALISLEEQVIYDEMLNYLESSFHFIRSFTDNPVRICENSNDLALVLLAEHDEYLQVDIIGSGYHLLDDKSRDLVVQCPVISFRTGIEELIPKCDFNASEHILLTDYCSRKHDFCRKDLQLDDCVQIADLLKLDGFFSE